MKRTEIWLMMAVLVFFVGCDAENPPKEPNDIVTDVNIGIIDRAVWLQIVISDANICTIDEAASALREIYPVRNAKEVIDIKVTIGDETHTASFEDLFEWMGFEKEVKNAIAKNNGCR